MKNPHTVQGTPYTSARHRPGHEPAVVEHRVPERAVEHSQRAASATSLPPEQYGHGGFKPSPEREAGDRIGFPAHPAPVAPSRDRATARTAEAEAERRQGTGAPLK